MIGLVDKLRENSITKKDGFHAGDNYTTCPNCSKNRKPPNRSKPCLSVKLDDRGGAVWNCHHCGWHGNVPGERDGAPYQPTQRPERKPAKQPPAAPERSSSVIKFFEGRGIGEEVLDELGIYQGRAWFPQLSAESPAIVFPYRLDGQVVNNKYRSPKKHFRQDKDALKSLYNIDSVVDDDECIFVEGEMDVAALMEAGYRQVVTLPEGAPPATDKPDDSHTHDRRFEALANCWDRIDPIKKYIIAGDSDDAGQRLRAEYARRLGKDKCFRVTWPDDCKDGGECLQKYGAVEVRRRVDGALGWPVRGLLHVEPGTLKRYREEEPQRLFSTGWDAIDDLFKIPLGRLMVVTGIPSHGKSEWVDAIAVNTAMNYGWNWAMCSPEHPMDEHAGKLAEKYLNRSLYAGDGAQVATDSELGVAEAWMGKHFSWIRQDGDEPIDLDFILERGRIAVMRYGIRGMVLDPYNEVDHHYPKNQSQEQYQGQFLARCRKFAARHELLFVIVAHPTKLDKARDGTVPVPGLYDISGSAHWKNKCDLGAIVYKPTDEPNCADIYLEKRKFKRWGKPGNRRLYWDHATGIYRDRIQDMGQEHLDV